MKLTFENILNSGVAHFTDYAIKGMLHLGDVVTIYGQSNVGKSLVVLEILRHISTGQNLGALKVRKGSIAYLAAEAPTSIKRRAAVLGLTEEDGQFFVGEGRIDLRDEVSIESMMRNLQQLEAVTKLRVVVFDTFSLSIPDADENSATAMSQAISNAKRIALSLDVCVILVHHEGKDDTRGARGSTAIKGGVDVELRLERSDEVVHLVGTKMRDGLLNDRIAFKIQGQTMGIDDDGDEVSVGRAKFVGASYDLKPQKSFGRRADSVQAVRKIALETAFNAVSKINGSAHGIKAKEIIDLLPPEPFEGLNLDSLAKKVRDFLHAQAETEIVSQLSSAPTSEPA